MGLLYLTGLPCYAYNLNSMHSRPRVILMYYSKCFYVYQKWILSQYSSSSLWPEQNTVPLGGMDISRWNPACGGCL